MSQKYVIGNWKLNPATLQEATKLAHALVALPDSGNCVMGVAPSFVHLSSVKNIANFAIGVQDIAHKTGTSGAFTGDVSACQVADLGASFTLIGHSERRQYHGETDSDFAQKIRHAFDAELSVIFCIGESKDEYESGQTLTILENQLTFLAQFAQEIPFIEDTPLGNLPKLLIAYEPVWAIGTGLTPTFDEIESVHNFISEQLSTLQIPAPILYGGSVNDKNAPEFAKSAVIDGALVGGASLKADSFGAIVHAFA